MSVALRLMQAVEFAGFRERFIQDWAADLVVVEGIELKEAQHEAIRRTKSELSELSNTGKNRFWIVEADGERVGTLWFSFGEGRAFLDDITIDETAQGKGFGECALRLMEGELDILGITLVQLNVYSHNPRAQALYERLGYLETGIKMSKRVRRADASS